MPQRPDASMWRQLLSRPAAVTLNLQGRVRAALVRAIGERLLGPGTAVPSSRRMAALLGISRTTVTLAYQQLVDEGFLLARPRSGYVVHPEQPGASAPREPVAAAAPAARPPGWRRRLRVRTEAHRNIAKPADWQRYPYPFLYGQFDPQLFPARPWRECQTQVLRTMAVREWAGDRIDEDDPALVEQIQRRLLPRRGIWAAPDEILVTIGAQQAIYLIAALLFDATTRVGLEDPGYPDARNVAALFTRRIAALPLDAHGLRADAAFARCDYAFVTPSHQCPTGTTMPLARRQALLDAAARHDTVLIEDDYDSELSAAGAATPAIRSLDRDGRVLYVGSFSKTIAPGLRAGFLVGPREFVAEARRLRRLVMRHPPLNNARTLALFLALGHHDALVARLARAHAERSARLARALARRLPEATVPGAGGGASLWVRGPAHWDARAIAARAQALGVLVEPGDPFFRDPADGRAFLRLGVSSIPVERIDDGVARLAEAVRAAT